MLACKSLAARISRRDEDIAMRVKAFAFVIVLAASAGLFIAMRGSNRADAAAGNCYASAQGPSSPTICE